VCAPLSGLSVFLCVLSQGARLRRDPGLCYSTPLGSFGLPDPAPMDFRRLAKAIVRSFRPRLPVLCLGWNRPRFVGPDCWHLSAPQSLPKMDVPLQQFLRTSPTWSWRAFTIFCLAMIFCTMQAVPRWAHPDWHLGWGPRFFILLMGVFGAATGFLTAMYRFSGLVARALAGRRGLGSAHLGLS